MALSILAACNDAKKEHNLKLKKQEILLKETNIEKIDTTITTSEAVRLAEKQFKQQLPEILNLNDAYIDGQDTFTGNFTGDNKDDVIIYYALIPNAGGNTIVGQGLALYQNNGAEMKLIARYEPGYLFTFNQIINGKIYIDKLEYAETDARCCPSIKTKHHLNISGSKVY